MARACCPIMSVIAGKEDQDKEFRPVRVVPPTMTVSCRVGRPGRGVQDGQGLLPDYVSVGREGRSAQGVQACRSGSSDNVGVVPPTMSELKDLWSETRVQDCQGDFLTMQGLAARPCRCLRGCGVRTRDQDCRSGSSDNVGVELARTRDKFNHQI